MGNVTIQEYFLDTGQSGLAREFDLSDRSSNVEAVWTANISLIALVGLFVGLRIFVRSKMMRKMFLDDGEILLHAIPYIQC
jgi:hypothetical protein